MNIAGKCDIGIARDRNEDEILIREDLGLFAVADGIGGFDQGELASRLALQVIEIFWERTASQETVVECNLKNAFIAANRKVKAARNIEPDIREMGTTLVALVYRDCNFYFAGVGDSRGYILRNGVLRRVTRDDSVVQELLEDGEIDENQAFSHPLRNQITQYIGQSEEPVVGLRIIPCEPEDIILLCSDGLTDMLRECEIEEILNHRISLEEKMELLFTSACDAGGKDNISLILLENEDDEQKIL